MPVPAPQAFSDRITELKANELTHFDLNISIIGKKIRGTLCLEIPDISVSIVIRTELDVQKNSLIPGRGRFLSSPNLKP
jgi:hypothetical protein